MTAPRVWGSQLMSSDHPPLLVELPFSMFSREAVKRAAYTLMHRATVEFTEGADSIICALAPERADADRTALVRKVGLAPKNDEAGDASKP